MLALANLCWLDIPRWGVPAAAARAEAAIEAARASPHAVSACYGFVFAALTLQRAGRWDEAREFAEHALAVADGKGIAYWAALAQVALGNDLAARRGDPEVGRATNRRGLASYRETQGEIIRPHILQLLADAEASLGDFDAAEGALEEAITVGSSLEARGFLPELWLRQARMVGPRRGATRRKLLLQVADGLGTGRHRHRPGGRRGASCRGGRSRGTSGRHGLACVGGGRAWAPQAMMLPPGVYDRI